MDRDREIIGGQMPNDWREKILIAMEHDLIKAIFKNFRKQSSSDNREKSVKKQ